MKTHPLWQAHDRGAVTAEFAVVLPAVVLITAVLLSLGSAVMTRLSCQNAAGVAARVISSGLQADFITRARAADAARTAASHADVVFAQRGEGVAVTVSCPVFPGPLGIIPARVSGEAVGIPQDAAYEGR